jgi:hypothetical protein
MTLDKKKKFESAVWKNSAVQKALAKARTAVRSQIEFIPAEVVDLYEDGCDPDDGSPIQPFEVLVNEEIRRYIIRGEESIIAVLGEPDENGLFAEVKYDKEGIPKTMNVPDCKPNAKGDYWWGLRKI